ncbi:MAG: class I SAM-dependent methyltransferase [Chloroflexi bacterium]|nr:class I SAM-dependent methyltransferase [Chloroflexota bacterium]
MTGKFRWSYDPEGRRCWQDPEAILAGIGLKAGFIFADIGCGNGFFALPAARLVGQTGRVYGVDSNSEATEDLERRAAAEGLHNISLTLARAEDAVVCQACADIVFFGNALHDFDQPARVLANARQMLSPRGRLVNLDWKKEPMEMGPPLHKRFSEDEAARLIADAGFSIESVAGTGSFHYVITARLESGVGTVPETAIDNSGLIVT